MNPETKRKIQIVLIVAIAVAGIRAAYVVYQRRGDHKAVEAEKKEATPLMADYYVTPKRMRPYDLKSAKALTEQPVWVKEGYKYSYYPFDTTKKRSDFSKEAGTLLPIQKLQIEDVVTDVSPGSADQKQMVAVFKLDDKTYSVPIGSVQAANYQIYSDEIFYIQDPRELYKHWPVETWQAIENHEVKPGMNELQADFAIGMGVPQSSMDSSAKTVKYPNGGKPLTIVYRNGKAAEIESGS
jgi:hypothetical protein